MSLSDLPWDVLYIIFTIHPAIYNRGVRLNREFNTQLTALALTRMSQWRILPGEVREYVKNLWRNPPIHIYLMNSRQPMYEEFLGGRNQLPGSPFRLNFKYQWTISMTNSRYSETYLGYPELVDKILTLVESGYYLDPCTYQEILTGRTSCYQLDPNYGENRSHEYLQNLLSRSSSMDELYQHLLIEMSQAAVRHHGGAQRYPEFLVILDQARQSLNHMES